jgi:hypothetical protein
MTETLGVGKPTGKPQITQHFPDGSILHPIDGLHWLQCDVCDAAWLGDPDEPCGWCWEDEQRQIVWQADRLLEPPDIDPDDATRPNVLTAWGQRLANGVKAGLVDEQQARRAWAGMT